MKTLKTLLESLADLPPGKAKWAKSVTESTELRTAIESEGETVGDAFDAAVGTVLSDPALTAAVKTARVAQLLESRERLEATADSEPPAVTIAESKTTAEDLAAVTAENASLKAQLAVRTLCEAEGFTAKPHQLKTLQLLESDVERRAYIADLKTAFAVKADAPRSGFRPTGTAPAVTKDAKAFAASIRA